MENTLENKTKFFALYWGLDFTGSDQYGEYMPGTWSEFPKYVDKQYLILKPLYSISDDDAIEVAKIMTFHDGKGLIIERKKNGEIEMYDRYNDEPHFLNTLFFVPDPFEIFSRDDNRNWFQYDAERFLEVTDFLRSRGYAVPWMGLSVEQLIEYGWIKIKKKKINVNNNNIQITIRHKFRFQSRCFRSNKSY